MCNNSNEYWERLKQLQDLYDFLEIYKDHFAVIEIINNLENKLPPDISKIIDIKNKYKKELEKINKMKNSQNIRNSFIDSLKLLDKDLLYIAIYKLCNKELEDLFISLINAEDEMEYKIFLELIKSISNQNKD